MHATSLSSHDLVHSKHAHQETNCKQPMKSDSERWLPFVGYFLNHSDRPPPCNEKAMLKCHCDEPPPCNEEAMLKCHCDKPPLRKNYIKLFVKYLFRELKFFLLNLIHFKKIC